MSNNTNLSSEHNLLRQIRLQYATTYPNVILSLTRQITELTGIIEKINNSSHSRIQVNEQEAK
jgi:hypothetical protein